jgi:hypothetical protein
VNPCLLRISWTTLTTLGVFLTQSQAIDIAPPTCRYHPEEVLWFSVAHSNVVAVLGNGLVGVWDFRSGGLQIQCRLASNDMRYPGQRLALSRGQRKTLAAVTDRERFVDGKIAVAVSVCELFEGSKPMDCWVELIGPANHGFVGLSPMLVLAQHPPLDALVVGMDTGSDALLWRSKSEDDVQTGTIVLADGQCYVNFCRDLRLRARDRAGKLVWERAVPEGKFAEPGFWPHNPGLPYVVVYESDAEGSRPGQLLALSARGGITIWRKEDGLFGSLRAVSDDGKKQAFFLHGKLEITHLPAQLVTPAAKLNENHDAVFSGDGRCLLCLPTLVTVSENKADNSYLVARRSKVLSVVDAETGKMLKAFPLTVPAERRRL